MTWTKTSDDYPDRLFDLSDAAYRLHHAATSLCNHVGFDGRLPKDRLLSVAVPPRTRRMVVVEELVKAGLWRDEGAVWVLSDFFENQPSAREIRAERAYGAARKRKSLARSDDERATARSDEERARDELFDARDERRRWASNGVSSTVSNGVSNGVGNNDPTRPGPSRKGQGQVRRRRAPKDEPPPPDGANEEKSPPEEEHVLPSWERSNELMAGLRSELTFLDKPTQNGRATKPPDVRQPSTPTPGAGESGPGAPRANGSHGENRSGADRPQAPPRPSPAKGDATETLPVNADAMPPARPEPGVLSRALEEAQNPAIQGTNSKEDAPQ